MKIEGIDVEKAISEARELLEQEKSISPALRSSINVLILLVTIVVKRLGLNSRNSSKPPSSDSNRPKPDRKPSSRKPGGQNGHEGKTLEKYEDPDKIEEIRVDRDALPEGTVRNVGYESRQVVDLVMTRFVTEYRAEILEHENGQRFTAPFPKGVQNPIQYGASLKAHTVFLSQSQLVPYERTAEQLADQSGIPVSTGSIFNFNKEASDRLDEFMKLLAKRLIHAPVCHADETGLTIDKKRHWLHCVSNDQWTYLAPHAKRGSEAMDDMGVLPLFTGVLCHDHWKPYFKYRCLHSLCNAHHLRELERAWEQDGQGWARKLKALLIEINQAVSATQTGALGKTEADSFRKQYRKILEQAETECPPPEEPEGKRKRGRLKRSKARNLLERLRERETETLRFMEDPLVPFTNNQGERDIRMTKVQQKISGCFRTMEGARMYCRIRSYLSTCRKQGIHASEALTCLFNGYLPPSLLKSLLASE